MDALTLAATSFIIAISLMITGRKDKLQASFIGLCSAIFVSQTGIFLHTFFASDFLTSVEYIGILAVAPFAFRFFRHLTHNRSIVTRGLVIFAIILSSLGAFFLFTPLGRWQYFHIAILAYSFATLAICYIAIMNYVNRLSPSMEKKRLRYLLFACPIALILCGFDLFKYFGFDFRPIAGIVLSSLLYFILLIIAYPQLNDLHDFFARALVIYVSTICGMIIFYFVAGFSGDTHLPSFTSVLMASFLIVISVTPIKVILKKIYSYFYPESKNVFTSLYVFDEKLEKEKSMMLAEMAPVFAHEIRNPLGSIKGAAQYLKTEAVTEEQQKLFDVIIEEVNRLNAVVNQFLGYARPHALKLQLQDINILIRKAVSVIAANELAEKISIVQELSDELPRVEVDEQQLMQVILNIALNAVESMPGGGTLTFRTAIIETSAGKAVSITIRDTGQGISKETEKNIFKPFFTTKERGVGLGLAICQKIIKDHGGLIRVKSIPGQGTVFFIRLNTPG
jgi:two-component system, NtrC family, sensor histidine kinase HydH